MTHAHSHKLGVHFEAVHILTRLCSTSAIAPAFCEEFSKLAISYGSSRCCTSHLCWLIIASLFMIGLFALKCWWRLWALCAPGGDRRMKAIIQRSPLDFTWRVFICCSCMSHSRGNVTAHQIKLRVRVYLPTAGKVGSHQGKEGQDPAQVCSQAWCSAWGSTLHLLDCHSSLRKAKPSGL